MEVITKKYICDVCKQDTNITKTQDMQVIFTTEQTEGRGVNPYFSNVSIHLCVDCKVKCLSGNYIFASGAMGYNTYGFRS